MSGTKTLIWAVVLLALVAFYAFYEIRGDKNRQEAARQRQLLANFTTDDAIGLTIQRQAETVRAEKREGHWRLTEPLRVPGDDQKYRELIRNVAELRQTRLVEERPSTLEPFGLSTPSLEIQVTLTESAAPFILRLGAQNPTGSGYYAQVEGDPAVYLVQAPAKDVLDASLHDLRDKTVLAFTPADVQDVHVMPGTEAPVVLERQDDTQWHVTAPVSAKADDQRVRAFLQSLHEVKVKAFVAENPTDLQPYGLDIPALSLALTINNAKQEHTVQTLLFGKVDDQRQGVYAKRGNATHVFLLPQDIWHDMPKTATALRDKTLLHVEREHIASIDLQSPSSHITIASIGPRQYTLQQPVDAAGDSDAIDSLLWELKALKAKDIVAEASTEPAAYGFDVPQLRVTLRETSSETSQPPQVLLFGAEVPKKQGLYARLADRPTIYLVDSLEAERILKTTAFDLRDKKIVAFEREAVEKIRLLYPTSAFTVERRGDAWRLSEPTTQTITQRWKVDNLLDAMSTLEYAKIIAETVEDGFHDALATPQVQITLWQQDGLRIGPLAIGHTTETERLGAEFVYAQAGPDAPLYAIASDFLNELPKTPAELTSDN